MVNVTKKGGKKQSFMPIKIRRSVEKSAKDAKLSLAKKKQLVEEVAEPVIALAEKKAMRTSALRKSILGRIERRSKKAATAWRKFEKNK